MIKLTKTRHSKEVYDIHNLSLSNAIKVLSSLIEEFDEEAEVDFNIDYEGDTSFRIRYYENETDEEYNKRLNFEFLLKQQRRKQYEELKKEFEG